jgi:hypothetical protein
MKRSLLLLGLLIPLCALSASGALGDVQVNIGIGGGPVAVYHYWYYPAWGIYYDYDARAYFYMEGGAWRRVAHLPPRYHGLGHYVVVESERGRPWARYDAHRAKFPPGQWKKEDGDWDHGKGHKKHHDGD